MRCTEIGNIPLITRMLESSKFQAYYLDFMEWFVAQHFNVASSSFNSSLALVNSKILYLESHTPYGNPHTNRPWSNNQVYRASVLDESLAADQGPVAGIQVAGIEPFVDARCKKVLGQLAGMARKSSGVDFDSNNWGLPE